MPREVLLALIGKVAGKYTPSEHEDLFKVLNATVKHLEWRQQDLKNLRRHEATIRDLKKQVEQLRAEMSRPRFIRDNY